ncbi:MAG: class II fructose-1,6-bisphosphate aldolase [Candidatus Improbicoccus devescovinae]|nr:MAG: class II fructose-1,6-bisphosphate aldolase [Candidatus Improbicoccus devescovinae]
MVNTYEMLRKARAQNYAVGAFNVCNMELIQGISEACKKLNSPVIFQVSPGSIRYAGLNLLVNMVKCSVEETGIHAALHLDHGDTFELCKKCIDAGFTSVMIDGSNLNFNENIKICKQVVDYAAPRNVSVEGELGQLSGFEEHMNNTENFYTNKNQVVEFVEKTGINSLAVAIGTSHGVCKFKKDVKPNLKFDLLDEISELLPEFPLVLHGASSVEPKIIQEAQNYGMKFEKTQGIPEEILLRAARGSICKINIDTDIRLAVTLNLRKFFSENNHEFDPRSYFKVIRTTVEQIVKLKIKNVLNSQDKA